LLVGSSWDSFQVQHHRRQGPRRGKEAASQASHVDGGRQNRSTRRPTLDRCINQRLHTLQRPDPGAVRLLHFGRSTPAALLATHQLHQYHGPIADDAISCNLLAPTRCGPLAHFSPSLFPRGAAVVQGGHVCQVSSHRLNIATFFLHPPDYCQPSLQHRLRR
jgi:hypothetical protein